MSLGRGAAPPPLALDFSGRRPQPGWLGWVLLAIGAIATTSGLIVWSAGERSVSVRESEVAELREAAGRAAPLNAREGSVREEDLRPAVRLARQLGGDWAVVLRDIAGAEDDRLALLSLELDVQRGDLRLTGEARNLEALFDYLARLDATPSLTGVTLTGYERATVGAIEVFRFTAVARSEGRS